MEPIESIPTGAFAAQELTLEENLGNITVHTNETPLKKVVHNMVISPGEVVAATSVETTQEEINRRASITSNHGRRHDSGASAPGRHGPTSSVKRRAVNESDFMM